MNELLDAAWPTILLVLFLALVFWPEVSPVLHRLRFAGFVPPVRRPIPNTKAPIPAAVAAVRRPVRRSLAPNSRVRRATAKRRVQVIEQPRTAPDDSSVETERIAIAKRLRDAGVSDTLIVETVWGVRRGGGRSYLEARDVFRTHVVEVAVVDIAA